MTKSLKKGFTLTELIIVIVIIGILAGVLIPTLSGYVKRSKISAAEQEANAIYSVYKNWQAEKAADDTFSSSFYAYYAEMTEKELSETQWQMVASESGATVEEKGETYTYFLSYAHTNKFTVYMDANGRILLTKKN